MQNRCASVAINVSVKLLGENSSDSAPCCHSKSPRTRVRCRTKDGLHLWASLCGQRRDTYHLYEGSLAQGADEPCGANYGGYCLVSRGGLVTTTRDNWPQNYKSEEPRGLHGTHTRDCGDLPSCPWLKAKKYTVESGSPRAIPLFPARAGSSIYPVHPPITERLHLAFHVRRCAKPSAAPTRC